MTIQEIWSCVEKDANPADFARAFFDSAIQERWNGLAQISHGSLPEINLVNSSSDTLADKAGHIAGSALDIALLSSAMETPMARVIGATALEGSATGAALSLGAVGAAYGGLLTPSAQGESLVEGRLKSAALDFTTFSVLGGAGKAFENLPGLSARSLAGTVRLNAAAGGLAGFANVQANAMLSGHLYARPLDYLSGAANYAAFGAAFGAFDSLSQAGRAPALKTVSDSQSVASAEPVNTVEPLREINMRGRPGPGVTREMLEAAQKVATDTGDTLVLFGSRQTGFTQRSVDEGNPQPFSEDSDLDLGVTDTESLFRSHTTDSWAQIPGVEHGPAGIFDEETALARGYLVIRPAKSE